MGIALDQAKENDIEYAVEELNFVMANHLVGQFGDILIDYHSGFLGKGFSVRPTYGGSGCG